MNGIQVQSGAAKDLVLHVKELAKSGVSVLRLSPQQGGMLEVIERCRRAIGGEVPDPMAGSVAGYWRGRPGMDG